jgi:two-component system sensor histidine kinase KdpD
MIARIYSHNLYYSQRSQLGIICLPKGIFTKAMNSLKKPAPSHFRTLAAHLLAAGIVGLCTLAGYYLQPPFSEKDVIMFYLVGAVIAAVRLGRGAALLYSLLSVSAFNYFFTEPFYTFRVDNPSWWLTFAVMFFACLVISTLAAKLKDQVYLAGRREREAQMLYALLKDLSASETRDQMGLSLLRHVSEVTPAKAHIRFQDVILGDRVQAKTISLPISSGQVVFGALEIENIGPIPDDQKRVLETCLVLFASTLEGAVRTQQAEQARLQAETEKTRNILLSSVSHDLRSPLAAITGSAETLLQKLPSESLLLSIRQEAGRLARIVSNLLDITRMESSQLKLNMMAYDPSEIIGSAVAACRETLKHHKLSLLVEKDLPFVRMDGLLISQLIQNLLENAARQPR